MKANKLREFIRQTIKEMEDELEEISVTGNISGYNTPFAFGKKDDDRVERLANLTGYTTFKEFKESKDKLVENRWLKLKKERKTPNQKIGVGIRELRNQLTEMEKFVEWYGRIKNENELEPNNYWKRTQKHLGAISERIKTLSEKIKQLSK
jgi:hypothetical protein